MAAYTTSLASAAQEGSGHARTQPGKSSAGIGRAMP